MKQNLLLLPALFFTLFAFTQKQQYQTAVVAFYNLENFYDTINNPNINDEDFLPNGVKNYNSKIYRTKGEHLAKVISQIDPHVNPAGITNSCVADRENETMIDE